MQLTGNKPALLDLRLYAVRIESFVMAAACVQWLKLEAPVFREETGPDQAQTQHW